MAKKKKSRIKFRIPLPRQTEKAHSVKKGAKGYSRQRAHMEARETIQEEAPE